MDSTKISEIKLFPYLDYFPDIHPSVFLASGVKIIGNVKIGDNSSVWYNTVIRGDVHYINPGDNEIQTLSIMISRKQTIDDMTKEGFWDIEAKNLYYHSEKDYINFNFDSIIIFRKVIINFVVLKYF